MINLLEIICIVNLNTYIFDSRKVHEMIINYKPNCLLTILLSIPNAKVLYLNSHERVLLYILIHCTFFNYTYYYCLLYSITITTIVITV